jgi:hypothetical protein
MDIKQVYIDETELDVYTVALMEQRVEHFSNEYVKWLEAKINYTRCSTQLLCVNKGDDNGITKGYEYKCIDQNKTHYRIVDNYSYEGWFAKEHFKEIT